MSLLNHTIGRIFLILNNGELHELRSKKLILYGKWDMDGVSGQQTTRQKWPTENLKQYQQSSNGDDDEVVKDFFF